MTDDGFPSWWLESVHPADTTVGTDDARIEGNYDPGPPMPPTNQHSLRDLSDVDDMIEALENALSGRMHNKGMVEYLAAADESEEDDDDTLSAARRANTSKKARVRKKNRFMTLNDLPRDDFFFGHPPRGSTAAPPDALIQTGRRLRDGASVKSLRAPGLGMTQPVYLQDCVWPVTILVACLLVSYFSLFAMLASQRTRMTRMQREHEREKQAMQTQHHDEKEVQMARILDMIMLKAR
jgi:hypothetical protein